MLEVARNETGLGTKGKHLPNEDFLKLVGPNDEDIPFEEEVLRNPYSLRAWLRYLEHKEGDASYVRNVLYERALRELPGSYKLWYSYLRDRKQQVRVFPVNHSAYESVNNSFERALIHLSKMPKLWLEFCDFLMIQKKVVRTRQTFDRALRALAITQHFKVWKLYIKFINLPHVPSETGVRVFKRFLKVEPAKIEDFIEYLIAAEEWDEAAKQLVNIVNDHHFYSASGKPKQEFWSDLCDVIQKHPDKIKSINVERIMRGGLTKFSEETGKLWTTLADYYIRISQFEKARDIFEEGMDTVITVRDFTQIWDAYAKFEDSLIAAQVETMESENNEEEDEEEMIDFDLRIARYENLIARQPLLVNSVLLRQNPHNVHEWQKRAQLYEGNPKMVVETYSQALSTVDPMKAKGKVQNLWINFAIFYESLGEIEKARKVFEQGVQSTFRTIDDLASIWCSYAEMEIRKGNVEEARSILQQATTPPRLKSVNDSSLQRKVYRSTKIWALYADVEESVGTFKNTKAVYDKLIDLKVATPQIIINYAHFLEEHNFFEESFKGYEKGIALFKFPHSMDIWVSYLTKFINRYGGKKLERVRELFEQVLEQAPAKEAKIFYIMYANLEEEFGLARRAMSIYDRATRAVAESDRFAMFSLYINRATEFFGVTRTREIYDQAVSVLPDQHSKKMCLRYAELERKLGEIDRARSLFIHASQFSDPNSDLEFWQKWREFEVEHGNQDTFKEMLRIKRTVQAQFNTSVNVMTAMLTDKQEAASNGASRPVLAPNDMEILERAVALANAEEKSKGIVNEEIINPEEIALDDEEENEIIEPADEVEEMKVPESLYEKNVPQRDSDKVGKESYGALAKLKKRKEN